MLSMAGERGQQGGDVGLRHRAERDAALRRCEFDQRLQPIEAMRARPDDLDREVSLRGDLLQRQRHLVGADGEGAGIARDE